jgi:hypothetical protein
LRRRSSNFLVAGRCTSTTHAGYSAARIGRLFRQGRDRGERRPSLRKTPHRRRLQNTAPSEIDVKALRETLGANGIFLGMET